MATLLDQTVLGPQAAQTSTSPLAGILGVNPGETIGSVLGAIGQSLLTSPSKNPLQNLPVALNNANAQRQQQEEQARQRAALKAAILATGEVDETMAETMAQSPQAANLWLQERQRKQQQANQDRSFNLEQQRFDLAKQNAGQTEISRNLIGAGYKPGTPEYMDAYKSLIMGKSNNLGQEVVQRQQAAASLGLEPDSPAYKSYVLTGRMPREDQAPLTATDKKAIMEADDQVMSAQTGIDALSKAKELSKKAYEGPGAATRGAISGMLGSEGGRATTELDNLVISNALQSMKAIFGANPTEGERAILLQIQGSSSQPDAVRQKIYDRAIDLMQRRLAFNKQRADSLRGGDYYKSGQSPSRSTGGGGAPIPSSGAMSGQGWRVLSVE